MTEAIERGQVLRMFLSSDRLGGDALRNLSAIAAISSDLSAEGKLFSQIIDELLKVEPKNYARVRDYFFELNDNAERRRVKAPIEYAKE